MKFTLFFLLLLLTKLGFGQVVFSEAFDEADDANDGLDAISATPWFTTCPGSVAASDYFKVLSGRLEARDTNSPAATMETGWFDVSSCLGISITMDIAELSNMEECVDCMGTGAPCIDWAKLEYNLDAGGWTEMPGVTCALAESPGEMIVIGDLVPDGGPVSYTSACIDFGDSLQIRISCKCWAGAEVWRFDNIVVSCLDCVLPVEVVDFKSTETENGVSVTWSTINERSNDFFTIERSLDGKTFELISTVQGAGNSSERIDYQILDPSPKINGTVYYRLKQFDLDGNTNFIESNSISLQSTTEVYFSNQEIHYAIKKQVKKSFTLNIYTLNGQLIHSEQIENNGSIPWSQNGFYILEIPELNFHQKLTSNSSF